MSAARRARREARRGAAPLPAVGARYIDRHGATWRVATVHSEGVTPYATLVAGGLRRTLSVDRLRELMEPVA